MTKPEEKKTVPEPANFTDRRIQLDRRCGKIGRRIRPDRRNSITDWETDRRIQLYRRCGLKDRRIRLDRRYSTNDLITDFRMRYQRRQSEKEIV